MDDVSEAAAWYFGTPLEARPASRRVIAARRCAYKACRELGFTWNEIAGAFDRDHSTVISAFNNGHQPEADDVAAVIANARARAAADVEVLG